jgi:lactase-phlorizin hydrolase
MTNTLFLTLVGTVGIVLNIHWAEPKNPDDASHVTASETMMQFDFGWFANPIFVDGTYPKVMVENIGNKSAAQGFNKSRLPEFTKAEKKEIKGDSNYTANFSKPNRESL